MTNVTAKSSIDLNPDVGAGLGADDAAILPLISAASGQPIVLMPDAPTVGGHPVRAVVAAADRHHLGQPRTGAGLRFRWTAVDDARRALADQQERSAAAARSLS